MAKRINTITGLKKLISSDQVLYVRWSRGSAMDARQGRSRDYASGEQHAGLSAVLVNPDWTQDDVWLAGRVTEYWFLRGKDPLIGCHIYAGIVVGTDSDGYQSISDVTHVATLAGKLVEQLLGIKRASRKG